MSPDGPSSSCFPGGAGRRQVPSFQCLCLFCSRCGKGKLEDGDGINLNDIEKVLPAWQVGTGAESHTLPFSQVPIPILGLGLGTSAGPYLQQSITGCTMCGQGRLPPRPEGPTVMCAAGPVALRLNACC